MPPNDDARAGRAATPDRPVPDSPASDPQVLLDHIREISQTVRAGWFSLLALLAFVGVIMMAHTDAAFFAAGVATELPVVGLAVPTVAFFIAAPLLMTAFYVHLHLYLVSLWDALDDAPARIGPDRLFDRVHPTMIAQTAVLYRSRARGDGSAAPHAFARALEAIVLLLVWLSAPALLAWTLWRSTALHEPLLTLWIGACLFVACLFGVEELRFARDRLSGASRAAGHAPRKSGRVLLWSLFGALIAFLSWETTEGSILTPAKAKGFPFDLLVSADLHEAELTRRPTDWRPYALWFADFEEDYRRREGIAAGAPLGDRQAAFREGARKRYQDYITALDAPDLQRADLRRARMETTFLPGADLRRARMQGANMRGVELQGADLERAQMQGADAERAQMQGADLYLAQMQGADLRGTQMQGAQMPEADLRGTQMEGANLDRAEMSWTNLRDAQMQGASLRAAQMFEADLRGARMQGADCEDAVFLAALVHAADLACRDGTPTQEQLLFTVGDADTILPEGLHVWSCLDRDGLPPDARSKIEDGLADPSEDEFGFSPGPRRAEFEDMLFCDEGETPQKVGRHPEPAAAG